MNQLKDQLLDNIQFLKSLSKEIKTDIINLFEEEHYSFGETIVREGEPADAFYLLTSGRARVLKKCESNEDIPLNVLRMGDEFGEIGLFQGGVRIASVRASTDVTVLKLSKLNFQQILEKHPSVKEYIELRIHHRLLHNFIHQYSELGHIPYPAIDDLLSNLDSQHFKKGDIIVHQGQEPGPMYIIKEGRLRVFYDTGRAIKNIGFLRKGDFFGELSVLTDSQRAASVEALTACDLLCLSKQSFNELSNKYPEFQKIIVERVAHYQVDQEARVPLDFYQETLSAEAFLHNKVHIDQETDNKPDTQSEDLLDPFASEEGYFKKKKGHIRRFPFIRQIDFMDCGAACLGMICQYFGKRISITRIRQLVHTSFDGSSLKAICRAATDIGLAARAVKVSSRNLERLPLPAIVHWENNHWIILFDVGKKTVRVADPGKGIRKLTHQEFQKGWSGFTALFDYTEAFEKNKDHRRPMAWLLPFIKPYGTVLLEIFTLALVASGLQLLIPIFTQVIVDRVVVEKNTNLLMIMVGSMGIALTIMIITNLIQRYMLSFIAVRIDSSILDFITRNLLSRPMSYFSTRRTGDIQRRLQGARQIREFLVQSGINGILAIIQIVLYLTVMAIYNMTLFIVFIITIPLYGGLMLFSYKKLKPLFANLEESFGKYYSFQIDAIKGIEPVKANVAEQWFRDHMLQEFIKLSSKQFRSNFLIMSYESAIRAVSFLGTILFLWFGAKMVIDSNLTIGGFVAFHALVAMTQTPITTVLSLWDECQLVVVLLNRLNDIFESEPEQGEDHTHLHPVHTLEGKVEFINVRFQYGGPESPPILDDITFKVPAGKTIAIVGRSGSGKTTLVKCLSGLFEITEGSILFDGIDMKTLNYKHLRHHIGIVLQDNYMFDDSIVNNISLGDIAPDMDRILWAAQTANAHDFISRLPMGYETRIGETGLALSGGQKQRISIARAIYKNPPILILDEATSSLDTESERTIQENLSNFATGRTTFIIAHRLSTIRHADRVIVLEKGKIVEQGTHDELIERRGIYFYLCSQQLGLD